MISSLLGLEKAMATHSSTLAWKIPWEEEPGRLQSMGSHRVGHDWSYLAAAAAPRSRFLRWKLHSGRVYRLFFFPSSYNRVEWRWRSKELCCRSWSPGQEGHPAGKNILTLSVCLAYKWEVVYICLSFALTEQTGLWVPVSSYTPHFTIIHEST